MITFEVAVALRVKDDPVRTLVVVEGVRVMLQEGVKGVGVVPGAGVPEPGPGVPIRQHPVSLLQI